MLRRLAEQKHVHVTGNEFAGSFSCRGLAGGYTFGEAGLHGTFAGHGVTGEFSFGNDKAAVTIADKPFWLPEMILKQKITEGLDTFCAELD